INPDIFGSMMQAVVHSDQRGSLGMHYTSVANIMKVIEPLFLNDFKEQLEKAMASEKNIENKLTKLLDRLYHLRLFDPACGSGNFLIIAYKELCKLEIEIFKRLQEISPDNWKLAQSGVLLTQFYGIELDDFAHETAKLSLWLAEHQMNLAFKGVFGCAKPTLPLQKGGHIVCGNATRLDWEGVCPKDDGVEIYIMGNPPYLGYSLQTLQQKNDLALVFKGITKFKSLDYIASWFLLGAKYIKNSSTKFAFVSTNSINQGEQVALLWPHVFDMNIEICFAHQSFKWTNNAKGNAGVTCVIVGVRNLSAAPKLIFNGGLTNTVKNINSYLTNARNITISKRSSPLSMIPAMLRGNGAVDGGFLLLNQEERNTLLDVLPETNMFIKKLIGSSEFINDKHRFCLWVEDKDLTLAKSIKCVNKRIEQVREFRLASKKKATQVKAISSHRFAETRYGKQNSIIIPRVSSERRYYIPIGFLEKDTIILDSAQAIYDPEPFIFAIISSLIHMTWVRTVAGRLKTDYRYSSALCYNTFPFPEVTDTQKTTLEDHVFNVLDEREQHPEKTMAELYDPDKMPKGLRQAHHEMDLAVEQCYRKKPFESDEERLEYLFKLYEEMIEAEKMGK
ncbi:MAG: class I SAM-dependent DNA methyltransferase, partial [Methylococcales bacterium]|nr:class I SAM-dependent DNA methyltransferase [Methylococcales bacterium]